MTARPVIATAGNVLAPALAALHALGYAVSRVPESPSLLRAESAEVTLIAEDPLLLLGLAKLFELRGADWQASNAELETWLAFDKEA